MNLTVRRADPSMLKLPNEIVEVICQYSSPVALLNLRAVHKRFTVLATRAVALECHIGVEVHSIVVEAALAGKGRFNIGKGASSDVKKCWIPQIREIIVHTAEIPICLQAVSRVQQMRTLQPDVQLRFEEEIMTSDLGRLVKRIQELPPAHFKVHVSLVDDAQAPVLFSDKWFASVKVRNLSTSDSVPCVIADDNCEVDIGLQGCCFYTNPFLSLDRGMRCGKRRTLEMHDVVINCYPEHPFDGSFVEPAYLDFERLRFSNCRFQWGPLQLPVTFGAKELNIENTAFDMLQAYAFPDIVSLTMSEVDDTGQYRYPTNYVSDANISDLLFSKFPNVKHLNFPNAILKEETRSRIFEQLKTLPNLETVYIAFRLPVGMTELNNPVDHAYFKQLSTSLSNLRHIEVHLPYKDPYIFSTDDLTKLRSA